MCIRDRYIGRAFHLIGGHKRYLEFGCSKLAKSLLENPKSLFVTQKDQTNPANSRYCLPPMISSLDLEERFKRCVKWTHVQNEDELRELLLKSPNPVAYDGFEPSGRMHIATILTKKHMVTRLTSAGFTYIFWIADWFAFMNHKMGGDLQKIKVCGKYFIEVLKATGIDLSRVRFLWASEEFEKYSNKYWSLVLDISTKFNLADVKRTAEIMGRQGSDVLTISQAIYSSMQVADAFFLGADVLQMGTDQIKVNELARAYFEKAKDSKEMSEFIWGRRKPIIISHNVVGSLSQQYDKMSKSNPESCLYIDDSPEEVKKKIDNAYCQEGEEKNGLLEILKFLIFSNHENLNGTPIPINFETKNGLLTFNTYKDFEDLWRKKEISVTELKQNVTILVNKLIQPIREHFEHDFYARDLLAQVKNFRH
eukprot:TRINITY_DN2406_c0_g1_i5.p1 TRINITY_DN2406_c0_g1~~TRINITY_DN2406_c0_g1_i5.p1  ORF type:complete len:423 (-),score=46.28 TRINITY_DN2406_c0_g1_i5:90-1358(-)